MKFKTLLFLIVTSAPAYAQNMNSQPVPATVIIRSEADDLATGFANAFSRLTGSPKYLVIARDGKSTILVSVKSVEATRGVLVVTMDSGVVHVVSARDVRLLSDGLPPTM